MNLEEFIKTRIGSLNELRTLLLFRARANTDCDATEVSGKLYLKHPDSAAAITALVAHGLLVPSDKRDHFRYQPRSEELARLVEELAEMDRRHPVTLINMIYERPRDIQAFADAFKLTKDKEQKDN